MPVKRRSGFTLVEMAVTLCLFAVVMGSATRVLLDQQRLYRELGQRVDLGDNLRAASGVLAAELWGLDAVEGDLRALGADSIRIRAQRVFSVVCGASTGSLVLRKSLTSGIRGVAAGDSLLVLDGADSGWRTGLVTSAATAATCPDSAPALAVGVSLPGPAAPAGAAVRGYEVVTYRSYQAADGAYYLGLRDAGGLQPVAGPLAAGGLELSYFDSAGLPTAVPVAVAAIRIRIRMESAEPVVRRGGSTQLTDSVVSWVTLRNNPRN